MLQQLIGIGQVIENLDQQVRQQFKHDKEHDDAVFDFPVHTVNDRQRRDPNKRKCLKASITMGSRPEINR
ncbi:hypothetical protein ACFQMB_11650 [Pseudobowmanella zhangzhouensis]